MEGEVLQVFAAVDECEGGRFGVEVADFVVVEEGVWPDGYVAVFGAEVGQGVVDQVDEKVRDAFDFGDLEEGLVEEGRGCPDDKAYVVDAGFALVRVGDFAVVEVGADELEGCEGRV